MKLADIYEAAEKATDVDCKAAIAEVVTGMKNSGENTRDADWRATPEKSGSYWMAEVRNWGRWEGDDGSGDYDFQALSEKSSKALDKIVDPIEKKYAANGVSLHVQTGEKNWITIEAKVK